MHGHTQVVVIITNCQEDLHFGTFSFQYKNFIANNKLYVYCLYVQYTCMHFHFYCSRMAVLHIVHIACILSGAAQRGGKSI